MGTNSQPLLKPFEDQVSRPSEAVLKMPHCESWDQGVEWAIRNLGSDSSLSDEHKGLLASELSYRK